VSDTRTPSKIDTTITVTRADGSSFQEVGSSMPAEVVLQGSPEGIRDMAKVTYRPIGHCIYCFGTENLTREHIVPFGLNGTAVLPAASCARCRKITSAFELQVLRGSMRPVRLLRRLRSRRKHQGAPLTARLTVIRDGASETIELPIEEFPVLLSFPKFATPRFLTGDQKSGIDINGVVTISFGPKPEAIGRKLGAQKLVLQSRTDHPAAFARMIAKIGYATAFALGDLDRIDGRSPVIPSILGEVEDIGRWVGTLANPIRNFSDVLHRVAIHEDRERGLLIAEVQLFSDSETPSYGVILGPLKSTPVIVDSSPR
jgi:hypothetical protein